MLPQPRTKLHNSAQLPVPGPSNAALASNAHVLESPFPSAQKFKWQDSKAGPSRQVSSTSAISETDQHPEQGADSTRGTNEEAKTPNAAAVKDRKIIVSNWAKDGTSARRVSQHGRSASHRLTASGYASSVVPQRQGSLATSKPPFSALQQHFSQKNDPKSSHKQGPSQLDQDSESTITNTRQRQLQMELAQLHLMHRSSHQVQQEWQESARMSLQKRFDDLHTRHEEMKEIARQQKTLLNQIALAEWCQGIPSMSITEKVQQVSQNITDLQCLLEPQGKYTRVLAVFESWFAGAKRIQGLRLHTDDSGARGLTLIDGIGDGWKAEAMVLERELTYCLRELRAFGEIREASSLGRMLSLHKALVSNLLEELDEIQWIESELMEREGTWMELTIDKLSTTIGSAI